MTAHTIEISDEVQCYRCGYDVRAHPDGAKCPECGAAVEESRRLAPFPRRPDWRDSDPRWRRRILAGIWLLAFLPLMDALKALGWDSGLTVPNIFKRYGSITLNETFLAWPGVYAPIVFCMGLVLLFSKERRRRRNRLDWTRRWGVICSYVVFLLSATEVFFISALVLTGIAACFISIPLKFQPGVTKLFVDVGFTYLHYGAYPKPLSHIVLVAFSSITILLACVPLYDALFSSGAKRFAAIPLIPLALFSLMYITEAAQYSFAVSGKTRVEVLNYEVYFFPSLLVNPFAGLPPGASLSVSMIGAFCVEAAKWPIVLGIAVWLSIAQLTASRRGGKNSAA